MNARIALTALTLLVLSAGQYRVHAIEDLRLQIQGTNAVLSWPSTANETFIVRYRARLDEAHPWTILTNSYPAASGTNRTVFTHVGVVEYPTGGGGGGGGGNPLPPEGASAGLGDSDTDKVEWPPLPPAPWDPRWIRDPGHGPLTEDGGGEVPLGAIGFYQVVRVGVHLVGYTNGMVISGQVLLPVEFGHFDSFTTLSEVFLSDAGSDDNLPGSSFPALPLETGVTLTGTWDTTYVPNGNYVLQVGARLDNDVVYLAEPISVTVSNVVFYPDPWEVGGLAIYVGAQTIYSSGTWVLDIYDDHDTHVGHLQGYIAADGYCNYPEFPGPGFSLDNTDGSGNQNPSTFYTLAMTVQPSGGGSPSTSTRKVFIEPPWFIPTKSVVCYKQPFQSWQPGWTDVRIMMEAIWSVVEAFHPNLLGTFVTPFEVQTPADWSTVTNQMARFDCRNFFYFGHGSGSSLGDAGARLRLGDVQSLLGNNLKDPLTATNLHPYRFVFMDGCNTADGDWPQAFGIPKKTGMTALDFGEKRGIRPRAFMGWNREKGFTSVLGGNQLWPPHMNYMTTFWRTWAERAPGGGPLRGVGEAVAEARKAEPMAGLGMVIYGAQDLYIDF